MVITAEKTTYHIDAFAFPFNNEVLALCRTIKDKYGWQEMNFSDGKWRFRNPAIIAEITSKYPETSVPPELLSHVSEGKRAAIADKAIETRAMELRLLLDTDFEVQNVKGTLYPYQKLGVQFFVNNKGKAIMADTMGTGKTCQSLSYLAHAGIKKSLVVWPASMKYAWANEAVKWTSLTAYVVDAKTKPEDLLNNADIIIINYDIIKKFFKELAGINFECLVLDEFHYIKNSTAARTKLVKLLAKKIPQRILLSGTPLLSRPNELFNGLNMMDSAIGSNYYAYATRFCAAHHGRFGWDDKGASNIVELQQKIARYFIRRTKEQVLPNLPKKRFIDIPVALSDVDAKEYNLAANSFKLFLKEVKEKTDTDIKKAMQAETLVKLGYLRQLTTRGKVKSAEELIENILDSGEKVVVFSCYNEPLEQLHETF